LCPVSCENTKQEQGPRLPINLSSSHTTNCLSTNFFFPPSRDPETFVSGSHPTSNDHLDTPREAVAATPYRLLPSPSSSPVGQNSPSVSSQRIQFSTECARELLAPVLPKRLAHEANLTLVLLLPYRMEKLERTDNRKPSNPHCFSTFLRFRGISKTTDHESRYRYHRIPALCHPPGEAPKPRRCNACESLR